MADSNINTTGLWTVTSRNGQPEHPMLFVHQNDVWPQLFDLLLPGRALPGNVPIIDPFAIYRANDTTIGWCTPRDQQFTGPGAYELEVLGELPDEVAIPPQWLDLATTEGLVMVVAYADIFLAEYLSRTGDFTTAQALRFFETSHLGMARVMQIQ